MQAGEFPVWLRCHKICGAADPKSGKRTRATGYRDGIYLMKIHSKHGHYFIDHRKQCLRMSLFKIHRIFCCQHIICHYCHRSNQ